MANIEVRFFKFRCYFPDAFACPFQWIHRVAHGVRRNNIFNGLQNIRLLLNKFLRPPPLLRIRVLFFVLLSDLNSDTPLAIVFRVTEDNPAI
jgi:hypothetical protein